MNRQPSTSKLPKSKRKSSIGILSISPISGGPEVVKISPRSSIVKISARNPSISSNPFRGERNVIDLGKLQSPASKFNPQLATSDSFNENPFQEEETASRGASPRINQLPYSMKSLDDSKTEMNDSSILLNRLKSVNKELLCSMIALSLQIILFITSVLVSIVTFKHLKYPDPDTVFACALYISGRVDSVSCFSIETIFIISTLSTILMFLILTGIILRKVKRTRTSYVIGVSVGLFCSFLTFVAACLYEVGLRTTIDHNGGKQQFIDRYSSRIDVNLIDIAKNAAWITSITWLVYAGVEFYEGLSFMSDSEYEVFMIDQ